MSYGTQRKILHVMHLFPFYFITNWHYVPQDSQWIYCFIVVLEDNHEQTLISYLFGL